MSKLGVFWAGMKGMLSFKSSIAESVIDYAIECVNKCIGEDGSMLEKVEKIKKSTSTFLKYATKYAGWCPPVWKTSYDNIVSIISTLNCALSDSKITREELDECGKAFKTMYSDWTSD